MERYHGAFGHDAFGRGAERARHAERDRIATERDERRRDEELRQILEAIESLKR